MDVLVGTSASIRVDFTTPTGMLIPDPDTTVYSLFDQSGQYLVADVAANPDPGATGVNIFLASDKHLIGGGRRFEKRTLWLRWRTGGKSFTTRVQYRIVPLVNYTASATDVRTFLGLNEDELTDEEVDLFAAYLAVEEDAAKDRLDAALASGTRLEQLANKAIVAQAVIDLIPSLQNRVLMATADGPNRFERFRTAPDFDRFLRDAAALRSQALTAITGIATTQPSVLLFAEPTDPITG
jgi:hypothetical protein